MRYTITGADKESGDDVNVVVNAITRIEAEHIAHTRGILVAAITPLDKEPDEGPLTLDDDPFEPVAAAPAANGTAAVADAAHPDPAHPAHPPGEAPHAQFQALSQAAFGAAANHGEFMEYKIMANPSVMLLTIAVTNMIKDGWELQGGVATCIINNAPNFLQAMIKHPVKKA